MISQYTVLKPTDIFDLGLGISHEPGSSIIIEKKGPNFYCPIISDFTNIGFRIAYFLWIMRGANLVEQLDYYSDHLHADTDDEITLRGAYGPRLRYWVGADQIVEANKINMDIEDPEDFVKPKGVDQLYSALQDLKSYMTVSPICIFNPAIDFEGSNDIPNLISIIFRYEHGYLLNLHAVFSESIINGHFINDYFVLCLLQNCMAGWLGGQCGNLTVYIESPILMDIEPIQISKMKMFDNPTYLPKDNVDNFWEDMMILWEMERHMRMRITPQTVINEQVSPHFINERLIDRSLVKIKSDFWRNCGYVLLVYSMIKHQGFEDESLVEFICHVLDLMDASPLLYELCHWIILQADENKVVKLAEKILHDTV